MKKTGLLILAACCVTLAVTAQTTYGVRAGSNFSSITTKIQGGKNTSNMLVGVAAGVYANLPVAPELVLQPSLMYEGKGGSDQQAGYRVKTRLNYLTLPVDLLYRSPLSPGGFWSVGLGPYFGYGLSGKVSGGPNNGNSGVDPFKVGGGSIKRFDFGADVQLGYESASGFNIGISTELGVLNTAKHGDSKNASRNTSFDILLGYTFGK